MQRLTPDHFAPAFQASLPVCARSTHQLGDRDVNGLGRCSDLYVQGCQQQALGQQETALRAFQELLIMGRQHGHQGWILAAERAIADLGVAVAVVTSVPNPFATVSMPPEILQNCHQAAVLSAEGRWHEATAAYRAVLALATQAERPVDMARCLNGLGLIALDQQHYATAESHFRAAAEVLADMPPTEATAIALHNLGVAHLQQEHYSQAKVALQSALERWQLQADSLGLAVTLEYLGRVYAHHQEYWLALGSLEAAADVLSELAGHQDVTQALAVLLMQVAAVCEQTQHPDMAIAYWNEALTIFQTHHILAPQLMIWQRLSQLCNQCGYWAIGQQFAMALGQCATL
ncbi:MAG: hypothetical protein ACFBSG_04040 [Leptolyngbyaceae cyanobacterium]